MTNFISWNSRGFKNKRDEIKNIISDHRRMCISLQETYLKQDDKLVIRSFECFRRDFHHAAKAFGRLALLISNDFPNTQIGLNKNIKA